MAAVRIRPEIVQKEGEVVNVLLFSKEEGWFVLSEYEIDKAALEKGKLISKTEPDIFPILVESLIKKARSLFGI